MAAWTESEPRLRELILYVSQRSASDLRFGAVKLNKILFYSDFLSYAMFGRPISGAEYQKLEKGPVLRRFKSIRQKMVEAGELTVQAVEYSTGKVQHRTIALREPRTNLFSPEELELVDGIIQVLTGTDARAISELSHIEVGWKVAEMYETIPYPTVLLSDAPLSEAEIRSVQRFAQEHGYVTEKA